jgi:hypothetical protein
MCRNNDTSIPMSAEEHKETVKEAPESSTSGLDDVSKREAKKMKEGAKEHKETVKGSVDSSFSGLDKFKKINLFGSKKKDKDKDK